MSQNRSQSRAGTLWIPGTSLLNDTLLRNCTLDDLRRMLDGYAYKNVQLHHNTGVDHIHGGTLSEVHKRFHQVFNKALHPFAQRCNTDGTRYESRVIRSSFDPFRESHWARRAILYIDGPSSPLSPKERDIMRNTQCYADAIKKFSPHMETMLPGKLSKFAHLHEVTAVDQPGGVIIRQAYSGNFDVEAVRTAGSVVRVQYSNPLDDSWGAWMFGTRVTAAINFDLTASQLEEARCAGLGGFASVHIQLSDKEALVESGGVLGPDMTACMRDLDLLFGSMTFGENYFSGGLYTGHISGYKNPIHVKMDIISRGGHAYISAFETFKSVQVQPVLKAWAGSVVLPAAGGSIGGFAFPFSYILRMQAETWDGKLLSMDISSLTDVPESLRPLVEPYRSIFDICSNPARLQQQNGDARMTSIVIKAGHYARAFAVYSMGRGNMEIYAGRKQEERVALASKDIPEKDKLAKMELQLLIESATRATPDLAAHMWLAVSQKATEAYTMLCAAIRGLATIVDKHTDSIRESCTKDILPLKLLIQATEACALFDNDSFQSESVQGVLLELTLIVHLISTNLRPSAQGEPIDLRSPRLISLWSMLHYCLGLSHEIDTGVSQLPLAELSNLCHAIATATGRNEVETNISTPASGCSSTVIPIHARSSIPYIDQAFGEMRLESALAAGITDAFDSLSSIAFRKLHWIYRALAAKQAIYIIRALHNSVRSTATPPIDTESKLRNLTRARSHFDVLAQAFPSVQHAYAATNAMLMAGLVRDGRSWREEAEGLRQWEYAETAANGLIKAYAQAFNPGLAPGSVQAEWLEC